MDTATAAAQSNVAACGTSMSGLSSVGVPAAWLRVSPCAVHHATHSRPNLVGNSWSSHKSLQRAWRRWPAKWNRRSDACARHLRLTRAWSKWPRLWSALAYAEARRCENGMKKWIERTARWRRDRSVFAAAVQRANSKRCRHAIRMRMAAGESIMLGLTLIVAPLQARHSGVAVPSQVAIFYASFGKDGLLSHGNEHYCSRAQGLRPALAHSHLLSYESTTGSPPSTSALQTAIAHSRVGPVPSEEAAIRAASRHVRQLRRRPTHRWSSCNRIEERRKVDC